jgi:DeoR family transcriptional regulator of aga operon
MPARRERLGELVAEEGFLTVADASVRLGVSEVTIRSDLRALEGAGILRRVHGGALAAGGAAREAPVEASAELDAASKRAIGRRAAALVRSGTSVMIDVGSTTLAVARALVERTDIADLVVVTNGLSIALVLEAAIPRFTVVVTGGTLRPLQHSLVDPLAGQTLAGLHADIAIVGCTGIDDEGRVTNVNLPETQVKRAMLAAAADQVIVAGSSKLGVRHLGLVTTLDASATVVTAGPGAEPFRAAVERTGARMLVATG